LAVDGRLDRRGNPRLSDLAELMRRYPEDFFYAPLVPPVLQRALTRPLAARADRKRRQPDGRASQRHRGAPTLPEQAVERARPRSATS
jgi:hypothetical protein